MTTAEDDHWEQPGKLFRQMTLSKSSCSSTTRLARSRAPLRRSRSGMSRTAEEPILPMAMAWHEL
jgi:hypothetical protein